LILPLCPFFVALPSLILYMIGKVLYYKILFVVSKPKLILYNLMLA
jgi:hypothetical protein